MTKTNKPSRRDAVLYRRMTVGLAAIGVCWLASWAWDTYWALVALVPMWCKTAVWALANVTVLARWARKAVR